MIKVNNVHKYYNYRKKNQIHVLNDITLDFPNRGLVVFLGSSGSGKTTLLNVLSGLDKINNGEIIFEDHVLSKYHPKQWDAIRNERIGYIFQNYYLFPQLSVFDNIAFVLKMIGIVDPDIIESRVNYILKAVNMYQYRKKRALQLSGGQQQRVAIARALVKNPDLIIADEPTGNLDSKNTIDIMNIIKEISKEKLVILVTHEKNIAQFYGDRIIEIKDGKIIQDYNNNIKKDYQFDHDDVIYLKDLNYNGEAQSDKMHLSYYSDEISNNPDSIKVMLILKNNTLYIDVKSPIKKNVLIDESTGVVIKNEHFVKKSREEITETKFNLKALNNSNIKREKPMILSIKQSIKMALEKVIRMGRKGKMVMVSLAIAGAIIAIALSIIMNAITIKPESSMVISKGYVKVLSDYTKDNLSESISYDDLLNFGESDSLFYINTYDSVKFNFKSSNGKTAQYYISGQFQPLDNIDKKNLIYGRLPNENNEILVSKKLADNFIRYTGQENGIWDYEDLVNEVLDCLFCEGKIVGIVDSNIEIMYMNESLATLASNSNYIASEFAPKTLLFGEEPKQGEALISKTMYDLLSEDDIENLPYKISGVYDDQLDRDYIFMNVSDIARLRYQLRYKVYVRTENPSNLVDMLSRYDDIRANDVYQTAYNKIKQEKQVVILSTFTSLFVLLLIAVLGFYFLMRSSLISRIYEISIFRALGVTKGNIIRSFAIESIMLTTISSIIGFIITSYVLYKIQIGLTENISIFKVNALTIILGFLFTYIVNLFVGLIPVYFLLRKTPAQILTQYDM